TSPPEGTPKEWRITDQCVETAATSEKDLRVLDWPVKRPAPVPSHSIFREIFGRLALQRGQSFRVSLRSTIGFGAKRCDPRFQVMGVLGREHQPDERVCQYVRNVELGTCSGVEACHRLDVADIANRHLADLKTQREGLLDSAVDIPS